MSNAATTTSVSAIGADAVTTKTDSAAVVPLATTTPAKTNTKLWKEYSDSLVKTLNDEVLKSKQIKKNTYYLMVDYEIAADGQVTFANVTSTPENAFLTCPGETNNGFNSASSESVTDSGNQAKKVKRKAADRYNQRISVASYCHTSQIVYDYNLVSRPYNGFIKITP